MLLGNILVKTLEKTFLCFCLYLHTKKEAVTFVTASF